MTWSWWRFAGIVCLGAAATASAWSQDHVIRTTPLMFHGQPNPDLPGWTIGAPANATISPEGRIMFVASTNPMEGGPGLGAAFTLIDGVISTVMQTGELIGQHPEIVCTNFLPPWRVFDDRSVMLLAVWSAGRALVTGQPGDLRIVAMSGSDSNPDPDYAHVVSIASPLRTASGHMAFTGYQKVWATVPGTGEFAVLLEEGDAVPGYEDTTYVDCFAKGVLADGRVIVGVEFEGSGLPIWEETVAIGNPATGEVVPLYGAGLPLPGVKGPGIRVAFAPIITGDGIIAFNAVFVDDKPPGESLGIWIGPLDDPTLVMRIGQPAPAMPGATFGGIYGSPILSPSGHAAIIAFAGGEGYPVTSSLFYWDGHQLLFRATRGTPIDNRPGMTVQAILSQAATLMINSNDFLIFESMVYVSSNS